MANNPNSLKEFQNKFIKAIFSKNSNTHFLSTIIPGGKLADSASALRIHKQGYVCRLTEALGEIYEGVWASLGDDEFFRIAAEYISFNRSISYNLSDYGKEFPNFLVKSDLSAQLPFLGELARFELAFYEIFHSEELSAIESKDFEKINSNPYATLRFSPSLRLLELNSRIHEIWKNRHKQINKIPDFLGCEYLAVYKQNNIIFVKKFSEAEFKIISALQAGMSLGVYLDQEKAVNPADLSSIFFFIASANIVLSIDIPDEHDLLII